MRLPKTDIDEVQSTLKAVLTKLKAHESAWPFAKPVDAAEVPEYYGHIKFPIDLKTMGDRLKQRYYVHPHLFKADMRRMYHNCCQFNAEDTEYFKAGRALNEYFEQLWTEHGFVA
uniref:Bromo domain-containing protein n=1 Tax=Plectus sambesii TaxID=2011161 RepID=A0A914UX03_9BILA